MRAGLAGHGSRIRAARDHGFRHRPTGRSHAPRPRSGSARAAGAAALAGARRPWENGRAVRASRLTVTKSQLEVPHACVTAGHPLGARVGAEILRRGGNAVDAAVATAFAMAVVEPFMSCLAGGGSMLIHRPRTGASVALDFNVEAPRRAHARMYALGPGRSGDLFPWRAVEGDANVHGHLAVAVPGSVAGLATALERWGTLDLRDAVAPAVRPRATWRAGRLVPRRRHGDVRRGARSLPRSCGHLPPRRAVAATAGQPRGRRPPALPRARPHTRAHRKRGTERLLPRGAGRGHRGGDPARRRHPGPNGSGALPGADGRTARRGLPWGDAPGHARRHGWRDGPRGAERPRVFRRRSRRTVQREDGASSRGGASRRVRGPTPLARGSRLGQGPVGRARREGRTPARWQRGSGPTVVASRGAGSTRGDSRAAEPAARGQPGRLGHPPQARRASARLRCARSTATGRSCR